MKSKNRIVGYYYILPAIIFMVIFIGYPIFYNIIISFQKVDLMSLSTGIRHFVGFKNYIDVFNTKIFYKALTNTFIYTIFSIVFQFTIGFFLALFFNINFKLSKVIRGLIMVAWLLPITVTALNFKYMFSLDGGIINEFLIKLGIISKPIGWLLSTKTALMSVIIANIWIGIPFNMILLLTGISTIPKSIYESSKLDGANRVQNLVYITLPSIKPAILAVITLGFINTFKVFDLVFIMTNGGPIDSTEVLSTISYRQSFNQFDFSTGATIANVLWVILLVVSYFYILMIQKDEVM